MTEIRIQSVEDNQNTSVWKQWGIRIQSANFPHFVGWVWAACHDGQFHHGNFPFIKRDFDYTRKS